VIVIGLDPHNCSHTPVAIDPAGTIVGRLKVTADKTPATGCWPGYGHGPSGGGLSRAPKGLGRLVAQHLVAAGEPVFDVRAKLAARARLLEKRHGRKTDKLDAVSIALVAQRRTDLQPVAIEDHTALLRLPSDPPRRLPAEDRRCQDLGRSPALSQTPARQGPLPAAQRQPPTPPRPRRLT